jgi:ABC-type Fe3+-siderophore transport system permease subunit
MTTTATAPAVTSRSQAKLAFFLVFFALTIFAFYEKNARILDPTSTIAQHFAPAKWYLPVHAFFGAIAMVVAAFQFSNRLRSRHLRLHRVLGYIYVTSVFISAPFAVIVAIKIPKSFR